jgi:8-oxo-dGTP pyrophosphatase MutT (NUDIX family)
MEENNIVERIKSSLKDYKPRIIDDAGSPYAQASVLIPLFSRDGQYNVIFTKRTSMVEHHKGQISFPGGAVDKEDGSLEETACREAYEEIGLLKKDVELLGRIDDELAVVSSFIIHPFVGRVPWPYDFEINASEVDSLIFIPLYVFMDETAGHKKDFVMVDGYPYHGTNYQYNGTIVWGATARIMENFISIIEGKIMLA